MHHRSEDRPTGAVYVEERVARLDPPQRFVGYREYAAPSGLITETGPGWADVEEAVAWARKRAPIVLLRTYEEAGSSEYWSAGRTRRETLGGAPIREWSSASNWDVPADDSVQEYGGVAFLAEQMPLYEGTDVYTARWLTGLEGSTPAPRVLEQAGDFSSLDEAIAWARERASYVILRLDPPPRSVYSAGSAEPPGLELPRWGDAHASWSAEVGPGDAGHGPARSARR